MMSDAADAIKFYKLCMQEYLKNRILLLCLYHKPLQIAICNGLGLGLEWSGLVNITG